MIHQGILKYARARFLWWALGLSVASIALYLTQGKGRPPSGGTWQGYVLGTIGALLIVWLTLLGVRKRSYSSRAGSVQAWTSAHVYLGTALLLVATLHCAAQFGWNVHTLSYVLMVGVILSGMVGIYAYINVPQQISENHAGGSRPELFAELSTLDRELNAQTVRADAAVQAAVASSIERTAVGGGVAAQLFGLDDSRFSYPGAALLANSDQRAVIDFVSQRLPRAEKIAEVPSLHQTIVLLCRRQAVLRRIRRDVRLRAWLSLWLYVHVPLTIALLAALVLHIVSTFMYW